MKKIIFTALMLCCPAIFMGQLNAQEKINTQAKATDIPNISLIGQLYGESNEEGSQFSVKEIELSFQHYLYPTVRADIFAAFHKEDNGESVVELEEAYLTFSDFIGVLNNDLNSGSGIGLVAGKKLLSFGKLNALHSEQWDFVDKPVVLQQFLGKGHGLKGEGAALSSLLPLPFFSQLSVGYWSALGHDEHHESHETEEAEDDHSEEAHGIEYNKSLLNVRLWNSFAITESREFELGFNFLTDNVQANKSADRQELMGVDLSLNQDFGKYRKLKLATEFLQANFAEEGEAKEKQNGGFLSAYYSLNKYYQAGIRYGFMGKHGDEGENSNHYSILLTRKLTDTSKFKFQVNLNKEHEATYLFKFVFGMGPHSHVLQ